MPDSDDPALDATQVSPEGKPTDLSLPSFTGRIGRRSLPDLQLGALLGRGGMGEVILGHDQAIGRDVAVKQLRTDKPTPAAVSRFLREAKIQARLEHPSIVPVHALGHDADGIPYFTMKRLTGTTLAELLALTAPPPRQRMLRELVDVCRAVELAHSRGVIHRDLKPSNIMVGNFGEVYVLDWGLARVAGEDDDARIGSDISSLDGETEAGALLGTPGYMAPEQIEGASAVGPAADVYSLGAILFEILHGEPLHPKGPGVLASTLKGVERPAASTVVAPELDELCFAALATRPADRPSASNLAEQLERYLDGDRDVEKRRELAATFVARAREAHASGSVARRAEAMQAAGRALALDPECVEAAAIVQTIMFEPATSLPPELEGELTASEVDVQQRQGKVAMFAFAVVVIYLATITLMGADRLALVGGIGAYTLVLATVVWRVTRRRARQWQMLLIATGNAGLAAILSRTTGSMIIVPAVTCIMAVSLTSYPLLIDRRGTVIGLLVASWLAPVVLEQVGTLASTFTLDHGTLRLTSPVISFGGNAELAIVIGANVVTIIVIGIFANALATSRRNAQRQSEITAWRLKQLLPRRQVDAVVA